MTIKALTKKIIKGVKFRIESRLLAVFALFDYLKSTKKIYKNPSICAFYQCHKRPKAVIATLDSFRKVYPNSPIYLFCDDGDDMSHIAKYYNCEYEYMTKKTGRGGTLFFKSKDSVMFYLSKVLLAAKNSNEDFLMILEDDTRVYKKIKNLRFDWNCTKANHHYSGKKLTSILRSKNNSIPWYIPNMYFAGCGGAMVNRKFFVDNFSDTERVSAVLDELAPYVEKQWPGALPQDAILTALIFYFGGTVGMYPGFAEVQYSRYKLRPFLGRVDVVHNDKSFYEASLSKEEEKIFYGK